MDPEGRLEPFKASGAVIGPEDIEKYGIKTYATEPEAWQAPAQEIYTSKIERSAYYHAPTFRDEDQPIAHFIVLPKKGSKRMKEKLLQHEQWHEKLRQSSPSRYDEQHDMIRAVGEIEVLLGEMGLRHPKKWPSHTKIYFAELLLKLPTEE